MKTNKPGPLDASPEVLAARLEQVRALYKLMTYLGQARALDPAEPRRTPR